MSDQRPLFVVSAGVIVERGRVLITQRKAGKRLAGKWEFPGGKVEDGEDPRAALVRELTEELGITVDVGDPVEVTLDVYPDMCVLLLFFTAHRQAGSADPRPLDVAAVRWADAQELNDADFPPADVAVLDKIRRMLPPPTA